LCIGASTGGPPAILALLQGLHPKLPVSIAITQHMPDKFTAAFAERLSRTTQWPVREAEPGTPIAPGEVVVAAGTHSLRVYRDGPLLRLQPPLIDEARGGSIVPSIDRMLESAAQALGPQVIAVILTGMSGDGVAGVRAVHARGGRVLVEAPQTAIMASMPEEVIRTGCVHEIVPLRRMADVLTRLTLSRPPPSR
jgi:two-component system chemotaxis response regulator CheB